MSDSFDFLDLFNLEIFIDLYPLLVISFCIIIIIYNFFLTSNKGNIVLILGTSYAGKTCLYYQVY